jgi:HD-GYP domain-containing protein (c-di-GMP phosphodiesterase class II)
MRLAELLGTLSLAIDTGLGVPEYHCLRSATLAAGLARELGTDEQTARDAYFLPLLAFSGCTAESHTGALALGHEIAIGTDTYGLDWGDPGQMMPAILRLARRGRGPFGGLWAMARTMAYLPALAETGRAHCEVAEQLAGSFGFAESFRAAVFQAFERWDGSGKPQKLKGEAIALSARIAQVATDANVAHRLGGLEGAIAITRQRAKKGLDPAVVECFVGAASRLCAALDHPSPWAAALAAEPDPWREADDQGIDDALRAMAHFTDLKCRYTHGHSTGVSTIAHAAAQRLGLDLATQRTILRAALVHDLGRVATSALVWEKALPLTDSEREQIRLHTYVGERVLSRAPSLAAVAEIACAAHERLDGSGYHRRLSAPACTTAARILAAADVYQALVETRPHRSAFSVDQAASELTAMTTRGELCPDAVGAVLGALGRAAPPTTRPHGLTDRELEVLRLLARGLTNKEIASSLDISAKTAGHHVQHVLEKLQVTTRAAATMIAMKSGLAQ